MKWGFKNVLITELAHQYLCRCQFIIIGTPNFNGHRTFGFERIWGFEGHDGIEKRKRCWKKKCVKSGLVEQEDEDKIIGCLKSSHNIVCKVNKSQQTCNSGTYIYSWWVLKWRKILVFDGWYPVQYWLENRLCLQSVINHCFMHYTDQTCVPEPIHRVGRTNTVPVFYMKNYMKIHMFRCTICYVFFFFSFIIVIFMIYHVMFHVFRRIFMLNYMIKHVSISIKTLRDLSNELFQ